MRKAIGVAEVIRTLEEGADFKAEVHHQDHKVKVASKMLRKIQVIEAILEVEEEMEGADLEVEALMYSLGDVSHVTK